MLSMFLMMRISTWFVCLSAGVLLACASPVTRKIDLQLIPQPAKITAEEGVFRLSKDTYMGIPVGEEENLCALLLHQVVSDQAGYELEVGEGTNNIIYLSIDSMVPGGKEGYRLLIDPKQISLVGGSPAGLFYGVQTLRQLLTDASLYNAEKKMWNLPVMEIEDSPAFPYRGMHLDVSRHFYPKEFVMKCLDLMSEYKLNRFHWHLTDAAGWRIEIKKYPELTSRGAWRTKESYMEWWKGDRHYVSADSVGAYGGFYTQEDIREVVAYAAKRHITIIPEIEMPGHSEEVISIYPRLGCTGEPYRNGELCIGNEETYEFLDNVLTEVVGLFPSEYIHIGGDEASTAAWKKCPKCQKKMKDEHLKDEKELQSYLIHRASDILKSKGRKLIGWDEILEGGLAPDATVMSWRGESGGIKAARMGHDVVMTPGGYCYFDSYQADPRTQPAAIGGFTPYLKVYSYHPVPAELTTEEARHILGAQANLWTEYISTTAHVEYMIFPRLLALSEVVWSPQDQRDPEDFKRRIAGHIRLLQEKGVNVFPLSDHIDMLTEVDTVGKRMKIGFDSEKYQPVIHYTVNGSEELLYKEPFYITDSARVQAFIVENGKRSNEVLDTRVDYHRAIGAKADYRTRYSGAYPAAGMTTLTDGRRGGLTYGDGCWQGFLNHIDVVIDLGSVCDLSYVSANFMQLIGPGVYMPDYVTISVSSDGETFQEVARINNDVSVDVKDLIIKDFTARFQTEGRYVRLFARKHAGFQFIDEVVVY